METIIRWDYFRFFQFELNPKKKKTEIIKQIQKTYFVDNKLRLDYRSFAF